MRTHCGNSVLLRVFLWVSLIMAASCIPEGEPAIDEASVIAANASVRADPTASSRTLLRLPEGERVDVLGKEGTWYRIRDQEGFEGWMDESTLIGDSTLERMEAMLEESRGAPVQNSVMTLDAVNLRLEPGRDTAVIRRLRRNVRLEVLDRLTTPRPDSDATDIWFRVRTLPSPERQEIGWVFAQLVEFEVPGELRPYTEGRIYTAVQILDEVVDPVAGQARWYVVAERRPGAPPGLAFDGIRVFTWNMGARRYETSLRLRDLRGSYPLEITGADPPSFRFHVLDPSGVRQPREFVMRGSLARELGDR